MIKLIVATHGKLGDGLVNNLKTITGDDDVEVLTLNQEDNSDDFEQKLLELLKTQEEGCLVLVDLVGGTPYNLAMKHLKDGMNYKVIAGVNAIMVIETSMKRAELDLDQLYRQVLAVGRAQIQGSDGEAAIEEESVEGEGELTHFQGGRVTLARVDHRLMHGQVVTKWLKLADAENILIVDDDMSQDQYMIDIYQQAAPNGVAVYIIPTDVLAYAYEHDTLPKGNVLLLFRSIEMVWKSMGKGLRLKSLQLGGIPNDNGQRQMVFTAVSLSSEDVELLNEIKELGTDIHLQVVPEEKGISYAEALKKLGK